MGDVVVATGAAATSTAVRCHQSVPRTLCAEGVRPEARSAPCQIARTCQRLPKTSSLPVGATEKGKNGESVPIKAHLKRERFSLVSNAAQFTTPMDYRASILRTGRENNDGFFVTVRAANKPSNI